jgi:hypothetical protein
MLNSYTKKQLENILSTIAETENSLSALNSFAHIKQEIEQLTEERQKANSYQMHVLIESMNDQITDEFVDILETSYWQDRITEIADSYIPIYKYDLVHYVSNYTNLASVDDQGLIEGCDDIYKIIQMSMYEMLSDAAHEHMRDLSNEKLEDYEKLVDQYDDIVNGLNRIDEFEDLQDEKINRSFINQLIINGIFSDDYKNENIIKVYSDLKDIDPENYCWHFESLSSKYSDLINEINEII